jgi:hypothetical protein
VSCFGFVFYLASTGTIHEITRNRTNETTSGSCYFVDRQLESGHLAKYDQPELLKSFSW